MIQLKIDTIKHNVILFNAMEDEQFSCFRQNCLQSIIKLTRDTSFSNTEMTKDYAKQISKICNEHNFKLTTGAIDNGSLMVYAERKI